jgi:hypothetical protein
LLRLFRDLQLLDIDAFLICITFCVPKLSGHFALSGKWTAGVDKGVKEKKALTRSENKILEPLPSMFERHTEVFSKWVSQLIYQTLFFPEKQF